MASSYNLPRSIYDIYRSLLSNEKAEEFSSALEQSISHSITQAVSQTNESLKANVKNELRDELVTRDFLHSELKVVDAEMKVIRSEIQIVDTKLKALDNKFNILIAVIILFGTVLNPNVLDFLKLLLK